MELREGMTYAEFNSQVQGRSKGKRNADYSTKDYFDYYRHSVWRYQGGLTKKGTRRKRMAKNGKWTISPVLYRKILTSVNSLLLEALLQGQDIVLPDEFGILYARQKEIFTKLEDGKVKTNRAINWKETKKLWYEDKESREAKQVVYQDNCNAKPYMRIQFGDFTNKRFLMFMPLHTVIRSAAKQVSEGKIQLPHQGTSVKAIKDLSYDREYSIHQS